MRLRYLLPLGLFVVLGLFLLVGLQLKPREIPSALIDKPVPEFDLPPVQGRQRGLAARDLRAGEVSLVNVFASWCGPCRVEHPLLVELAAKKVVPVHGINYKDRPDAAAAWLDSLGDPYDRTGADLSGRVSIDWGVYGVPETFIVDRQGRILLKHVGALRPEDIEDKIMPLLRKLGS
ncbi:MAG: DsbE family thiol:disulfide interchange protein [Alphaproteobacteria bacterium]|nr:DsbE family thiol:disulfide interchange protein [Alphaproteobacteria bacterium]